MIDHKDIMYGSVIRHVDSGEKTIIGIKTYKEDWMVFTSNSWCLLSNCIPYNIEGDILLDYGFHKIAENRYGIRSQFVSLELRIDKIGATITSPFSKKVYYFHELQNACHVIMGKDLVYKG